MSGARLLDRIVAAPAAAHVVLGPLAGLGYRYHRRRGVTPRVAYSAMRKLYANRDLTLFNDLVARSMQERPSIDLADRRGLVSAESDVALERLRADGVVVFDAKLPDLWCHELETTARSREATVIGRFSGGASPRGRFDPRAPGAVRYDLDEIDVLGCPVTQRLLADASLLDLVQRYLGAAPVHDLAAMWWSAPGPTASSEAAQLFHHDLDRLRFVKLFVYLTDVDGESGPHVFVRGSHRSTPAPLRADRRFGDEEVLAHFDESDLLHLTGARGTMFLADTRGLHKGAPVRRGHRLVFQLEWTTSLFGHPVARMDLVPLQPELAEAMTLHPAVYQRLLAPQAS